MKEPPTWIASLFLWGHFPASIAARKGRSYRTWYWYGVILLPLALAHALIMKPDFGPCPDCGSAVNVLSGRKGECSKCGKRLVRRDYEIKFEGGRRYERPAVRMNEASSGASILPWVMLAVLGIFALLAFTLAAAEGNVEALWFGLALLAFGAVAAGTLRAVRKRDIRRTQSDREELEEADQWAKQSPSKQS